MSGVDGVLFDIEGVIVLSWDPVPGAADVLAGLRDRGLARDAHKEWAPDGSGALLR